MRVVIVKMMMTVTLTMTFFCIFRLRPMIGLHPMEITKAYVTHGSVVTWASAAEVYQHFTLIASSIFSSSHRLLSPAPFGNNQC